MKIPLQIAMMYQSDTRYKEIPIDLSSGEVRHDIRHEKLPGLFIVPIAID